MGTERLRGVGRVGIALAAMLLAAASAPSVRAGEGASLQARFEAAREAYDRCHWEQAWQEFSRLADEGHAESARLALEMWRFGPALFRHAFAPDADRVLRWRTQAAMPDRST